MVVAFELCPASESKQAAYYKLYCAKGDENVVTGNVTLGVQHAQRSSRATGWTRGAMPKRCYDCLVTIVSSDIENLRTLRKTGDDELD